MKVRRYCRECLKDLARRTVTLSGGSPQLLNACFDLIDGRFTDEASPTGISNAVLRLVKQETGVYDPHRDRKASEFRGAMKAAVRLRGFFPDTLEGVLRSSAFGNGGDFFMEHSYEVDPFPFRADMAKIEGWLYTSNSSNSVLILGDNIGDFVFDIPLVAFLKKAGKQVFYAVKEHPVQNDMAMADVERFGARELCGDIISTGTDEVGIRREEISGKIRELWEGGGLIIAKGMGNYESISEFDRNTPVPGADSPVLFVMKVKCKSVAEAVGRNTGEYIAILGGDHGEKRLL